MSRRRRPRARRPAAQPALWSAADVVADDDRAGPSSPVQPERDVRVKRAQRSQITWGRVDLDAEVPAEHAVRAIAAVVDQLDLRSLYSDVRARGETYSPGYIDPYSSAGAPDLGLPPAQTWLLREGWKRAGP